MPAHRIFEMLPGDAELIPLLQPSFQTILSAKGTYVEIAEEMGVALGTIRSRLNRARTALLILRERAEMERAEATSAGRRR